MKNATRNSTNMCSVPAAPSSFACCKSGGGPGGMHAVKSSMISLRGLALLEAGNVSRACRVCQVHLRQVLHV